MAGHEDYLESNPPFGYPIQSIFLILLPPVHVDSLHGYFGCRFFRDCGFGKPMNRPTKSPSLESNSLGICFLTHLVLACFFTFFAPNKIIVGRRASGPNAPNPKGLHQDLSEASCQL